MAQKQTAESTNKTPKLQDKANKKSPDKWMIIAIICICIAVISAISAVALYVVKNTTNGAEGGASTSTATSAKKAQLATAYDFCVTENTTDNFIKELPNGGLIMQTTWGSVNDPEQGKWGEIKCILDVLGNDSKEIWLDAIDQHGENRYSSLESFDINDYSALLYTDMNYNDADASVFHFAMFDNNEEEALTTTSDVCNAMYPDRGEPVLGIYHYKDYEEYESAKRARVTFGDLSVEDNGKSLIFDLDDEDDSDKLECIYAVLDVPARIKNSINHSISGHTEKDSWENYTISWLYYNNFISITIYK